MSELLTFFSENLWTCFGLVVLILIYIIFEITQKKHQAKTLSPQDAIQYTSRGKGIFLDIRGEKAYNESHIVGSIQTNIENLKQSVKFLQKYKRKPVVVYCNSGQSSKSAVEVLNQQGFEDVSILRGGFSQWKSDNLPVDKIESKQTPKKQKNKAAKKALPETIKNAEENQDMSGIEIYYKETCPFCIKALGLLDNKNVSYTSYDVLKKPELREEMIKRANGRTTVPEIFINNKLVGGCDELFELESEGKLEQLIKPYTK
jgi:thiosulfate/3-mercaptopyruvate sulfurtransferase